MANYYFCLLYMYKKINNQNFYMGNKPTLSVLLMSTDIKYTGNEMGFIFKCFAFTLT